MEEFLKELKAFFYSFIWVAILVLAIDIITKNAVYHAAGCPDPATDPRQVVATLIPGFLNITFVTNRAAAFGLGFDNPVVNRWLYICISLLAAGGIIAYYVVKRKTLKTLPKICMMLILAGALGNFVDRAFYWFNGFYVIDWIDFCGIWPYIFNIADCGVVCGILILVVYLIVDEVMTTRKMKKFETENSEKVLSSEEKRRQEEIDQLKNSK